MSQTQFHRITQDEFEAFLDEVVPNWTVADTDARTTELVYSLPLPSDDLEIRIYSTLQGGEARDCGSDAIRLVLYSTEENTVVGGRKKTLRIGTWRSNLEPKIRDLYAHWRDHDHGRCGCGGRMVVRDGKYGEFLGCSNYPRCKNTEDV